jgi:hypothetical protein
LRDLTTIQVVMVPFGVPAVDFAFCFKSLMAAASQQARTRQ